MKDEVDERSKHLWNTLHLIERNLKLLAEAIEATTTFREARDAHAAKLAKAFDDCAITEPCMAVHTVLAAMGDATRTLSTETHEIMVVRPEQTAIVELTQIQDWGVVPMKRLLEDRDKAIKAIAKLQRDVDEKTIVLGGNKEREKRARLLTDQKRRVDNVNALLELHWKRFEFFRVTKMKVDDTFCFFDTQVQASVAGHERNGAGAAVLPLQRRRVLYHSVSGNTAHRPEGRRRRGLAGCTARQCQAMRATKPSTRVDT
ncbi:hypothetical protein SDRG_04627 [Saprolegnia diclina VS20]|uniref:Uncharacterized protein n=1 Tax=Saprolegnia diclina (strain VS20) TaxID=1156394 RepID=T0QJI6_SAPDV|nr:hypothetical protein SDRG_04627 [Saprolegnia diclina VS20]EQC38199.1 hypothetical protein SDRG_04627 [Saprolegnia diclina VS20]|eukprot:XP_008608526.1 hypothetical protein SDRG_04627 [Saprolegnia diclina VS20]